MGRTSTVPRKISSGRKVGGGKPVPKLTPNQRRHLQLQPAVDARYYTTMPRNYNITAPSSTPMMSSTPWISTTTMCSTTMSSTTTTPATATIFDGVSIPSEDILSRALADIDCVPPVALSPISDNEDDDIFMPKDPPTVPKKRHRSSRDRKPRSQGRPSELRQLLEQPVVVETTTAPPQPPTPQLLPSPPPPPPVEIEVQVLEEIVEPGPTVTTTPSLDEEDDDIIPCSQVGEAEMVNGFLKYWEKLTMRRHSTNQDVEGKRELLRMKKEERRRLDEEISKLELEIEVEERKKRESVKVLKRLAARMNVELK